MPPVIPGNGEEILGSPWLTDPEPVVTPDPTPAPDATT
jgi:hypothetical protein